MHVKVYHCYALKIILQQSVLCTDGDIVKQTKSLRFDLPGPSFPSTVMPRRPDRANLLV